MDPPPRTHRQERTPARSVDSTMAVLREATHPEDSPALAGSTAGAASTGAAASTEVEAMEAAAEDSSHEVINHETRNH